MGRKTFKKITTTEEQIKKINPQNMELLEEFLKAKKRTCSEATITMYKSDLMIFFCWLVDNGNEFYIKVKKRTISSFFSFIQDELQCKGKRFAHYRSVLSSLSSFAIRYYEDDELGNFRNFVSDVIESPDKSPTRERIILTKEDCDQIFKSLAEKKKTQEACLFALALYSGERISELVQMQTDFFNEEQLAYEGLFYKTPKIRTKGKGIQGKQIPRFILHDPFKPYLDAWLKERKKFLEEKGIEDHGYLFVNKSGEPASQEVIRAFVSKWGKIINKELHPHVLRHRFTTLLQEMGCSNDFIKTVVQWSTTELVDLYSDKTDEDMEFEDIGILKNALKQIK